MNIIMLGLLWSALSALAADEAKLFKTPEAAVEALVNACKKDDVKELVAIFGPGSEELVSSGDDVQDRATRAQFLEWSNQSKRLVNETDGSITLHIGSEDWPFPIPIVKKGDQWRYDAEAGKEEILNRRIGRNELNAIEVCREYVLAQREYQSEDRDGDQVLEFAQKIMSEKGQKDGLFWETGPGEEISPLGPLVAEAVAEGYKPRKPDDAPRPYHGYFYRILTRQGKNAPGGECDYVINGNMIAGYALIAYPADYGNSGVMTFEVSQLGVVYEKDLGEKTAEIVKDIKSYDPDSTWKKSE
jgi:hypothetical protein